MSNASPRSARGARPFALLRTAAVIGGSTLGVLAASAITALYLMGRDHPAQYEPRVRALENTFRNGYPRGEVLLSGSSFFERWITSAADLAPLRTTNIGIGGTKAGDHLAYFSRMVLPFQPAALVLYIGSNDINGLPLFTKSASHTVRLVTEYIATVRRHLPQTRIYYVAITEAPARRRVRDQIQQANNALADLAASTGDFTFIDTAPQLLRPDGSIDESLFGRDRLHFNSHGYDVFATAVRAGLRPEYDRSTNPTNTDKGDQ